MKKLIILAVLVTAIGVNAQEAPNGQKLFESGRYEQAASVLASPASAPEAIYLAGQSYVRLNQPDAARAQFARLVALEGAAAWPLVGQSATAVVDGNAQAAIEAAMHAVETAPAQFHAQYQLGLAYSSAEQWEAAAAAFERAATIDPSFAYAHYYAGLAQSKVRRLDRMALHFEYFLRLAPEAPERPAVVSLMRSVRGH